MEHHNPTSQAESGRLLGIAEKLLRNKDFSGCRDFAILAQETEPLLEGSHQILAVAEVLLAADNKRLSNNQPDWYSILQVPLRTDEAELIKKQYRRLALLLHPDKNKFAFSDLAFRLVADSWAILSDPAKKSVYDSEFTPRFSKMDLVATKKQQQQFNQQKKQQQTREDNSNQKLPVRRGTRGTAASGGCDGSVEIKVNTKNSGGNSRRMGNFWTTCPYCYNLYEYPRHYEGCCLRCDNEKCKRAFTATEVVSMPPIVSGREAYYCCWGFFPMGFVAGNVDAFPKWMPPTSVEGGGSGWPAAPPAPASAAVPPRNVNMADVESSEKRKRGRPRKKF